MLNQLKKHSKANACLEIVFIMLLIALFITGVAVACGQVTGWWKF